ncbi:hypothetical protein SEEN953_02134 [Salmonella enterica subsp. enterica serovar Newport str. CVM 33953]|nr:hypothetical protein SEEN953_02134 [Salmonella enterica subsp. enterica serovar Newport str. CVM 33953]
MTKSCHFDQFDGWGERNKSCAVFVHSYATS